RVVRHHGHDPFPHRRSTPASDVVLDESGIACRRVEYLAEVLEEHPDEEHAEHDAQDGEDDCGLDGGERRHLSIRRWSLHWLVPGDTMPAGVSPPGGFTTRLRADSLGTSRVVDRAARNDMALKARIEIESRGRTFASGLLLDIVAALRETSRGDLVAIVGDDP